MRLTRAKTRTGIARWLCRHNPRQLVELVFENDAIGALEICKATGRIAGCFTAGGSQVRILGGGRAAL